MKKLFFIPIMLSIFLFTSCEKDECKDCTISYEAINGSDTSILDESFQILGYNGFNDYLAEMYPSEEFCGETLDTAESLEEFGDIDYDGISDYRVFWDCN